MNPRELLIALIKHQGRNRTRASQGTVGRFGSRRAHLPRNARWSARWGRRRGWFRFLQIHTRQSRLWELCANARDLWTVIYRPAHRRSRRESTRITERSCQRPRFFPLRSICWRRCPQTCANPPRSMSAPLISGAIRVNWDVCIYGVPVDACQRIDSQQSPGERRSNESADIRHVC